MYTPGRYQTWMHVLDPLHVGAYQPAHHPDQPTVLSRVEEEASDAGR